MIAVSGWTNNDQTTITNVRVSGWQLTYSDGGYGQRKEITITEKTITQLSLERLLKLMFIPRKLQLKPIYNRKPLSIRIRNNLPQRIRINEQSEL